MSHFEPLATIETPPEPSARSAVLDRRFWSKVKRDDERGFCQVWTGYRDRQGYGLVMRQAISTSPMLAHRYAWMQLHGPIPEGAVIRHRCDNPPCVEPTHLLIGTQADNIHDRQVRGRHRPGRFPGEAHPSHRLTETDVFEMRRLHASGVTNKALAQTYGLNYDWTCRITRGVAWSHLRNAA